MSTGIDVTPRLFCRGFFVPEVRGWHLIGIFNVDCSFLTSLICIRHLRINNSLSLSFTVSFLNFANLDIISALQQGDQLIFEEVYRTYHERVYFYVQGKTQSAWMAEEATQLTFIKLWRYRASLNPEVDLFVQIFRIARTTMIDLVRQQQNRDNLQHGSSPGDTNRNPTWEQVAGKEVQAVLLAAMEHMPPVRKQVFTMSRLQGLSHQEIAEQLSISVKTVEGHITLALKHLRKHLPLILLLLMRI